MSKAEEAKLQPQWVRERKLRGWSQAKLAEMLGCDTRSVNRWENGRAFPSPQLCEVFGKNAEELGLLADATSNSGQVVSPHPLDLSSTNSSFWSNIISKWEYLIGDVDNPHWRYVNEQVSRDWKKIAVLAIWERSNAHGTNQTKSRWRV